MRNLQAPPVSHALLTALSALDMTAACAAVEAEQLGPDSIVATYHRLQERQQEGTVDPVTVAGATSMACKLLSMPSASSRTRKGGGARSGRVAVASPAGEAHQVDTQAVAAALAADGWSVDLLCGSAGEDDLRSFLGKRGIQAAVVVCNTPGALPKAARALRDAHANAIPVLLSGPAFGAGIDDLRPLRLGADGWAPDVASVVELLGRWSTARPVPDPLSELSGEYLALAEAIPWLREKAVAGCFGNRDRPLLESLLEHLEAAVLVDDGRVLLDFVRAELTARRARGRELSVMTGLLGEIGALLAPDLGRSRSFVEDAKRYLQQAWRGTSGEATNGVDPLVAPHAGNGAARSAPIPIAALSGGLPQGSPGAEARVFSDLLMLAAMACDAPTALVSLLRDGRWSTLSFGSVRGGEMSDPALLEFVAARNEPVEIPDVATHPVLSSTALSRPPHDAKWLLGVPLGSRDGGRLGVLCIFDRQRKELNRAQAKAVMAIARQLEAHLQQLLRPAAVDVRPAALLALPERRTARRGPIDDGQQLLRSHEVASLFDVTERTVINWAASGKLPALRTIGGHLRFRSDDVANLLAGQPTAVRSG